MPFLDQQLHGYRHGHELLSATVKLPKTDQDVIDRLSDVAGPLRPGERFDPYLTCYPLPSGSHYVLARTWQDFEAPRAGCVRTRSLLVPMSDWTTEIEIVGLIDALSRDGPSAPIEPMKGDRWPRPLPHVEVSQGIELVEALFLEDRKAIAVFDAPDPEGITLRLLAAFWPSFRRTFSVSTFALSPRYIGGRSFDLVFAPKDARSRFSDWPGRRVDARKPTGSRHRWSNEIIDRIFGTDRPSLLRDDALGELASQTGGTEAELRISLLWNELQDKLETSPNAALGLLDIANSRSTRNIGAIRRLEPALGQVAHRAVATQSPPDAWRFLLALTDKLHDVQLKLSVAKAIRSAAIHLATRAPAQAIENVPVLAKGRGNRLLLGAVGDGVAQSFDAERAARLLELDPADLLQLLLLSPRLAEASLSRFPLFSTQIAVALAEAPADVWFDAKRHLLRLLTDDKHADAARLLIANLNHDELISEIGMLAATNGLGAASLHESLANRAGVLGITAELRDVVASVVPGTGADALLLHLIARNPDGLRWLLDTSDIADERRIDLLRRVLRSASVEEFSAMISGRLCNRVLQLLMRDPASNLDLVERVLEDENLDASTAIATAIQALPHATPRQAFQLASRALEMLLPRETGQGRAMALDSLLKTMSSSLNGSRAIKASLKREVSGELVAANLAAFNRAEPVVRQRIMIAIEDMAKAIVARGRIDFPESAAIDAACLLSDSAALNKHAFVRASATLMPFLFQSLREPASPLIAVAFPPVYQELKKEDDVPDFLKFFGFIDWDKCKTARRELVDALMKSNWRATDIALAAARAGDTGRILRRIAEEDDGLRVIKEIKRNLSAIPHPWRAQVYAALRDTRGD